MTLKKMLTEEESRDEVLRNLANVSGSKWMVAVWKVEDGKIYLNGKVTWEFPTGDFEAAIRLLESHLKDILAAESTAEPPPLGIADFLKERYEEVQRKEEIARGESNSSEFFPFNVGDQQDAEQDK